MMKIDDIDDVFVVEVNSHDERWHIERLRVIVERNQKCLIEKRLRCWVPIAFADTFDGALAIKRCLKNDLEGERKAYFSKLPSLVNQAKFFMDKLNETERWGKDNG